MELALMQALAGIWNRLMTDSAFYTSFGHLGSDAYIVINGQECN